VLSGIKEIKQVMSEAERARQYGTCTILFIDEIHRFNRAQQDAFLPHVEKGNIRLIGATTENPSFEINSALLSRCRVYVLKALTEDQVAQLLQRRAHGQRTGLGNLNVTAADDVLRLIAVYTTAMPAPPATSSKSRLRWPRDTGGVITEDIAKAALQKRTLIYDKSGEEHYNLHLGLHKSVRNSDPDAALYWLGRMLEAGEDPLYVARRVVRMGRRRHRPRRPASPRPQHGRPRRCRLHRLPEGNLALAQAVVYLSVAPSRMRSTLPMQRYRRRGTDRSRSGAIALTECAYGN